MLDKLIIEFVGSLLVRLRVEKLHESERAESARQSIMTVS